ncbi:MAG: transglycosylase SLT domain-containing protein [Candidatus Aminicenantes bacterium]|nr:transglycosylase SLT domain-containing protein [Candidatus Aminicenantes bacterium]
MQDHMGMNRAVLIMCCCGFLFFSSSLVLFSFDARSDKYDSIINKTAVKYGLPADLIHSIIRAESNYNPRAVSPKGAVGLMQLMPDTARQYGVTNIFDPLENIEGGTKYLKDLSSLYQQNLDLVLAAYNAGQEAVKKYRGIPPYRETLEYIERVKSSYGKESILTKTKIYKYTDSEGRIVITNNVFLYLKHRKK